MSLALLLGGCIHLFTRVAPQAVDPEEPAVELAAPLKVHLLNGEVAVFRPGAMFFADSIRGSGRRYRIDLRKDTVGTAVESLPLDSVAALETFKDRLRPVETIVISTLGTGGAVVAAAGLAVAIFGSCPTMYSDGILEAEAFPNSIAPLLEMRDVDRLAARPKDGVLELEVRNEALETHYINHVELLEVGHPAGSIAVPDNDGLIWILEHVEPPLSAVGRDGRDVTATIAEEDDVAYETPAEIVNRASDEDVQDYVDLEAVTAGADSAVVYLRLRNSLLSSVVFYEHLLDAQGARALNWMSEDLNSIGGAVRLGTFYQKYMGLRIDRMDGGAYHEIGRVREVGPIAWDHVAIPISTAGADTLRLRLRFIADAWRIDRVAVATGLRRVEASTIPITYASPDDERLRTLLSRPDQDYVVTNPGEHFRIGFRMTETSSDSSRTYFVATQGFYTEWVRGRWVSDDVQGKPVELSSRALVAALRRWQEVRSDFELQFEASKIPMR